MTLYIENGKIKKDISDEQIHKEYRQNQKDRKIAKELTKKSGLEKIKLLLTEEELTALGIRKTISLEEYKSVVKDVRNNMNEKVYIVIEEWWEGIDQTECLVRENRFAFLHKKEAEKYTEEENGKQKEQYQEYLKLYTIFNQKLSEWEQNNRRLYDSMIFYQEREKEINKIVQQISLKKEYIYFFNKHTFKIEEVSFKEMK
jgi:hypothetical protein